MKLWGLLCMTVNYELLITGVQPYFSARFADYITKLPVCPLDYLLNLLTCVQEIWCKRAKEGNHNFLNVNILRARIKTFQTVTSEVVNTFSVETWCYDDWKLILGKICNICHFDSGKWSNNLVTHKFSLTFSFMVTTHGNFRAEFPKFSKNADRKSVLHLHKQYMQQCNWYSCHMFRQLHRHNQEVQHTSLFRLCLSITQLHKYVYVHSKDRLRSPHAAARTQTMLQKFGLERFEHLACSPDLAPSDFYMFPKLKEFLGGRSFKSCEELKDAIKEGLNGLAAEVYVEGVQKLVTGWQVPECWWLLCGNIT